MSSSLKLYKYVSPEGIDILQNLRILVQDPCNFNDPFEFTPGVADLDRKDYEDTINGKWTEVLFNRRPDAFKNYTLSQLRELFLNVKDHHCLEIPGYLHKYLLEFRENFIKGYGGVICLCADNIEKDKEILLWSHYSNSHKGLRVKIDAEAIEITSEGPEAVQYLKNRLILDPLPVFSEHADDPSLKILMDSLISKSDVWQYEHEYRWIIKQSDCHSEYDSKGLKNYYIAINPLAITEVDAGLAMAPSLKEAIKDILRQPNFKHVVYREAEMDRKKYALKYNVISL